MEIFSIDTLIKKKSYDEFKKEFLLRDIFLPKFEPDSNQANYEKAIQEYESRLEKSDYSFDNDDITIMEYKVIGKSFQPTIETVVTKGKIVSKNENADYVEEKRTKDKLSFIESQEDIYTYEETEKSLNFYNDYLFPKISKLPELYKNEFNRSFNEDKVHSDSAIKNYCAKQLSSLTTKKTLINGANHLNKEVKKKLIDAVEEVYEYISNDYYQKYLEIDNKIHLNLSKIQIITLFHLLIQNEYINKDDNKITEIFRKIEQSFTYYDNKTDSYKNITKARKLYLEYFGENGNQSDIQVLKDLKQILCDDDFYYN